MKKIATTIYLSPDLHRKVRILALQKGISFTQLVEKVLEEFVLKEEKNSKGGKT